MGIILIALLTGLLYRLGGTGGAWWKNTKVRDLGVPLVCVGWLYFALGCPWWALFLSVGVMYGSLTTYNKWASKLIYGKDCNDVKWISWLVTGMSYGVALFIISWVTGNWMGLLNRTLVLGVFTCLWSEAIGNATWEEFGRGFLIGITLPLMIGG